VALTKVDEYDPSVAASLPRVFSSAPIRNLISRVGPPAVACGSALHAHAIKAPLHFCH
jgi:hypothetical protein